MRLYVITTGAAFALLASAHVARIFVEGEGPLEQPIFVFTTVVSVAFCIWAIVVLRQLAKQSRRP